MAHKFKRVEYKSLNPRQQESYNFQKVAAALADYGFTAIRLSDDWRGADFNYVRVCCPTFGSMGLTSCVKYGFERGKYDKQSLGLLLCA